MPGNDGWHQPSRKRAADALLHLVSFIWVKCRQITCKVLLQVLVWSDACEDGLCTIPEDRQHRQPACSKAFLDEHPMVCNPADSPTLLVLLADATHKQNSPFFSSLVFSVFSSASDLPRLKTLKNWPPVTARAAVASTGDIGMHESLGNAK
jgi:hypothetical protein